MWGYIVVDAGYMDCISSVDYGKKKISNLENGLGINSNEKNNASFAFWSFQSQIIFRPMRETVAITTCQAQDWMWPIREQRVKR